jgi:hypothetical protein
MREIEGRNGGKLKIPEKGETNNPNGRPKKSFSLMNETLKKEGYEPLTKGQLMEAYSLLFSIDEAKISELAEDDTQPLAIRLIIQEMTEPQSRGKALVDMRDYLFGKAREELKIIEEQPLFPDAN